MNETIVSHVKNRYENDLLELPNVVGVTRGKKWVNGVETDEDAILVLVTEKKPKAELSIEEVVPESIEGVKTDVYESDEIAIFQDPRMKWRPAPGGVSIGHYRITAGTLGAVVEDAVTKELLVLSNNHVLANSNDAELGDLGLQPGPADGGTAEDELGGLLRFVFIEISNSSSACFLAAGFVRMANRVLSAFSRTTRLRVVGCRAAANEVDAAVLRPNNPEEVSLDVMGIGRPARELAYPKVGLEVQKFGRTTEYTKIRVIGVDATIKVNYGGSRMATFKHQIVAGVMSAGGDSGSLVMDMWRRPIGLLFAGSDKVTIMNEIGRVLSALGIEFPG